MGKRSAKCKKKKKTTLGTQHASYFQGAVGVGVYKIWPRK